MSEIAQMVFLVVDDMPHMLHITKGVLNKMGFQNVITASDGKEAIEILSKESSNIGFIISDWSMPVVSGLELFEWVQSSNKYKRNPFLMVTAEKSKEQVMRALTSGVRNYVVKPYAPRDLMDKINQLLNR